MWLNFLNILLTYVSRCDCLATDCEAELIIHCRAVLMSILSMMLETRRCIVLLSQEDRSDTVFVCFLNMTTMAITFFFVADVKCGLYSGN